MSRQQVKKNLKNIMFCDSFFFCLNRLICLKNLKNKKLRKEKHEKNPVIFNK